MDSCRSGILVITQVVTFHLRLKGRSMTEDILHIIKQKIAPVNLPVNTQITRFMKSIPQHQKDVDQ